jgi:NAD(P)-dependent dehydrogenase (short-subunit alcohol dehydrogenase family)
VEPPRAHEVSEPRVAIVAGAHGELGRAVVESLVAVGWSVASYGEAPGAGTRVVRQLDLCDREAVANELGETAAELGAIGGLVVLPGPVERRELGQITPESWHHVLRSHLLVAANLAWGVLPGMVARGAGNIVTIGSDAALGAGGAGAHCAAASGAVLGFTKALAIELAKTGVQVNAISAELPVTRVSAVAATAAYLLHEQHFFLGQLLPATAGRA